MIQEILVKCSKCGVVFLGKTDQKEPDLTDVECYKCSGQPPGKLISQRVASKYYEPEQRKTPNYFT